MSRIIFDDKRKVVAGSAAGIAFGSVVIFTSSYSLLGASYSRLFHWSQIQVSIGATVFLFGLLISWPVSGWALDRLGTRAVAGASIACFSIGMLLLARAKTLPEYYFALGWMGLLGGGTNVVSYARAISLWFHRHRGLALGVAASSQAVGATLIPLFVQGTITRFGANRALLVLASIEMFFCLPTILFFVKNRPHDREESLGVRASASHPRGRMQLPLKGIRGAIRTGTFWVLCGCFSIAGFTVFTVFSNIVFILQQTAGMQPAAVARVQAITGVAVLLGRISCGTMLDRANPFLVAACTFGVSAFGVTMYAWCSSWPLVVLAALCMGLSAGGESDIMPYIASRIYGTRCSSQILGWFLFSGGFFSAIGPVAFARTALFSRNMTLPLMVIVGFQCLGVALLLRIRGRTKQFSDSEPAFLEEARILEDVSDVSLT